MVGLALSRRSGCVKEQQLKKPQANEAENVLEIWRRTIGKQMAKVDKTFNELR